MKTTIIISEKVITFTRELTYPSGETVPLNVDLKINIDGAFRFLQCPPINLVHIGGIGNDLLYTKEVLLLVQEAIAYAEKEVSNIAS